jgi:hypothetical protein
MKMKWLAVAVVLLGLVVGARSTQAGPAERTMYLTFSRAVGLPGVELPAGAYVFELALPMSSPSVVRVSSRDRHKTYLLALTNPIDRPARMRADQAISFGEASLGAPPPITAWFPDGTEYGRQFIYR